MTTSLKRASALVLSLALSSTVLYTELAYAASLENSLRSLVNSVTGKLLPIVAVGYLGKNVFAHIQGDPGAKGETIRVVIGIVCLLGLQSVWSFIRSQVR